MTGGDGMMTGVFNSEHVAAPRFTTTIVLDYMKSYISDEVKINCVILHTTYF